MPQLRKQHVNHTILLLSFVLFIEALTDLPIRLYYLHENTVLIHTGAFCMFWNWEASVLNIIGLHLIAFASIERHLFVFHNQFLTRHRLLFSILPMIFSIIYPLGFYTAIVFGSWWCTNTYDYSSLACGAPCYLITSTFFPFFGILTHHVLPVFIVLFANSIIVIRVWYQKTQMHRANVWRKNIRMSIQLFSIAFTYLIVWIPQCILFLLLSLGTSHLQALSGWLIYEYTGNFTSFTVVFCPFVVLAGLPQLRHRMKQDFTKVFSRPNAVNPNTRELANNMRQIRLTQENQ
ncbi:hypothetical protein I4U23_027835 [Adineta vaga]|nr:hypothetical protein I4U23_027835 [Adineta vaga]